MDSLCSICDRSNKTCDHAGLTFAEREKLFKKRDGDATGKMSFENLNTAEHVCGMMGYDGMKDPPCPGCEERTKKFERNRRERIAVAPRLTQAEANALVGNGYCRESGQAHRVRNCTNDLCRTSGVCEKTEAAEFARITEEIRLKYQSPQTVSQQLHQGFIDDSARPVNPHPEYVSPTVQVSKDKLSNPKDIVGSNKLPLHLWPASATATGCLGLLEGALKYGRSNWRESGVRATIYVDAIARHCSRWLEGMDNDPDSGLPQWCHILACCAIITDAEATGKLIDDRQYNGQGTLELLDKLTAHVARLKALHADKSPRHYTIADNPETS